MRSTLQTLVSKKFAGLVAVAVLGLGAANTFAAEFTVRTDAPANAAWTGSNTWQKDGFNTYDSPSLNDNVTIDGTKSVILDINQATCASLTISNVSGAANPSTSLLNVNGRVLTVYGNININGANGQRAAELRLSNGTVNYSGTVTLNTTSSNVSLIMLNATTPGTVSSLTKISPLPVELVSFAAVKKNAEVALNWVTASEKNNTGFEVQTSADGKNYETVAFVASQNGNATSTQRYAYTHKTGNKEGLVYYRLKQVDMDGTFAYYNAKVVDLGRFASTVSTFPNPFQNQFELNLTAAAAENAQITVTDMAGKTVYASALKLQKGANALKVSLENQPAGMYLLKATAGNQTYTNRLVKQ